ncbi:hypothetical protein [Pelosinus baikalensis]|uniref:Uncharacterized protein n=1 Tax=Pelosinus baikalensis TaxID=2892015 RepID=A0ABS8HVJ0_9FIRM|nr:hypothetical protein [Pelosinus baikalensis]MCC5466157.1 hypothetical protein [Pelosinus baikalensis]
MIKSISVIIKNTNRKYLITVIAVMISIVLIVSGSFVYKSLTLIPEMFQLNSELRAEGYYMGEFEFKMVGIVYYIDKGQYITAFSRLNQFHKQLKNREGLIKVPKFADKKEELEFYLGLQNPRTGAFMDDSYPLCTYVGSTLNMVNHLELLAKELGQPLHLRYQLSFLDQMNTGEKLETYLDDLSTAGWIASKLPKTPYILAFEIVYFSDLERVNLYDFSPEWKHALLQWFYEKQDSKTGFWGPRLRSSGQLLDSGDLVATSHIVRLFVDDQGNNRHSEFPLRYKEAMFANTLQKLSMPMPKNLAEQHDWSLATFRALRILTNFLWSDASTENKDSVREIMENIMRNRFEKFYIPDQGAFSYYSGALEADLDGTGEILDMLRNIGVLSRARQERLWGKNDQTITDLGVYNVSEIKEDDFELLKNFSDINSIRLYRIDPVHDSYTSNVASVIYPKETSVLDSMELLPKMSRWLNETPQNMGNWISKEWLIQELAAIQNQPVPVSKGGIPLELANTVLQNNRELIVVGFDILQVPKYKMTIRIKYK